LKTKRSTGPQPNPATRARAAVLLAAALLASLPFPSARAVLLARTGDPLANVAARPLADGRWETDPAIPGAGLAAYLGSFTVWPIAPSLALGAKHVGGQPGDQVRLADGTTLASLDFRDDPESDLRLWRVAGSFPHVADLYPDADAKGRLALLLGRGTRRGAPVIERVTNHVALPTEHVTVLIVDGRTRGRAVGRYHSFPRPHLTELRVTNTTWTVTEQVTETVRGWQWGEIDGWLRWGLNRIDNSNLTYHAGFFDADGLEQEAFLSTGDSGGALFLQDTDGAWKLAGIHHQVSQFGRALFGHAFFSTNLAARRAWITAASDQLSHPTPPHP